MKFQQVYFVVDEEFRLLWIGGEWDEAALATYVADPTAWLKTKLAADDAKSAMSFKLAKGGEDVAAYLASLKPAQ